MQIKINSHNDYGASEDELTNSSIVFLFQERACEASTNALEIIEAQYSCSTER